MASLSALLLVDELTEVKTYKFSLCALKVFNFSFTLLERFVLTFMF